MEYNVIFIHCLAGTYDYHVSNPPLTPKISLVILLTVCHTIYVM